MVGIDEMRRRLPVVDALPPSRTRGYLPRAIAKRPRPAYAVWELTTACDHACLACGPRAAKARPDELTTDEALRLVDEMAALGVGEVTLIGGEAYLRNDFLLVIRAIREAGMRATMTTGGLHLNRKRIDAMVEAGIQQVSLSIDGLEAAHDRLRGVEGSFRQAFTALQHLREARVTTGVNTQINRLSCGGLVELGERVADAGARVWQVFLTIAHGNAADNHELLLQPYELESLYRELEGVMTLCERRQLRFWPGNNLGYFGPLEYRLRQFTEEGHYPGCQAGRVAVGIESNGMVKSCPSLGGAANTGGSWREHGLEAIWTRAPELRYIERRTIDDLWGYCRECYYAESCMAGCTAMTEPMLGRPGNNPYCHHRVLELSKQGRRERFERVAPASPEPFAMAKFRLIEEPIP